MKTGKYFLMVSVLTFSLGCQSADKNMQTMGEKVESSKVTSMVKDWPARPRLAAQQMMSMYGEPTEVTASTAIWMNAGPYKRVEVSRTEVPHDFPKPHMDFLRHTVTYNVPIEKIDDLTKFDASMTFDKTAGEMSAKCDLEGHNVLTLNLARDIINGTKSVEAARRSFATNVIDDQLGKKPAYVEKLQFEPQKNTAFADVPNIPGSPVRATTNNSAQGSDAEVLAFVIAADDNEILASAQAQKKNIRAEVKDYAKMVQMEHGKNQATAMKLGSTLGTKPTDTKAVDELRVKGANGLAMLVPLDGKEFEKAYLDAMVKNHQETIAMIDNQLLKSADNASLKKSLTATRGHVASHLEQAKSLQ